MEKRQFRADLIFGGLLLAAACVLGWLSLDILRLFVTTRQVPAYYTPGTFPLLIGVGIGILGVLLATGAYRGWRQKADFDDQPNAQQISETKNRARNTLIASVMFLAYIGTLGRLPFVWTTIAFLCVSMLYFQEKRTPLNTIARIAFAVALAVTFQYIVENVLFLPLP